MKRRALLVALAVVLAIAGTIGVYAYAKSADKRAVANGQGISVLVATKRVSAGTSWQDAVRSGSLSVQNMPKAATPSQALTGLDAGIAQDAVAQSEIAPGTPVLREVFGPATSQTGVLAIPKGKIAITVSLSADADVAGYIAPRSQVIVFVTAPLKLKDGSKSATTTGDDLMVTRTVVPKATVIATSQASPTSLVADGSNSSTTSGGSVMITLAFMQHDAERVINAQKVGQLTLGLLSAESVVAQDGGVVNAGAFDHTTPIWVN
jgi:pilus assembly protein CpaB